MADGPHETVRFDDLKWIAPVETKDELPEVDNATAELLCYVQSEDAVYRLLDGTWTLTEADS